MNDALIDDARRMAAILRDCGRHPKYPGTIGSVYEKPPSPNFNAAANMIENLLVEVARIQAECDRGWAKYIHETRVHSDLRARIDAELRKPIEGNIA